MLATLLLSQGVPMLCGGDESGRTQQGHANAYDQDNARSWLAWELTPDQQALLDFTRAVVALVQHSSGAAAPAFLAWPARPRVGSKDRRGFARMGWKCSQRIGRRLRTAAWGSSWPEMPSSPCLFPGQASDDSVLLILNAQPQAIAFVLPALQGPASGRGCCVRLILSSLPPRPSPRARSTPCRPVALLRYARGNASASGRA